MSDDNKLIRLQELFEKQQQAFDKNRQPSASERIKNLKKLKKVLIDHDEEIADAINKDYGCRARGDSQLAEILTVINEINYSIKHLRQWMKPEKRDVSIFYFPAKNYVMYQPVGVVGVIAPWNFPLLLAMGPLVASMSAGNRTLIRMSDSTLNTGNLLRKIIKETFDEDLVVVIDGAQGISKALSELPLNHLLFTGSTTVGRYIMAAAAKNLTPVTLELGGKSPALIGPNSSIKEAVSRLIVGHTINAGQACISPDYILCPEGKEQEFLDEYTKAFSAMYPTMRDNSDYTNVINDAEYQRLMTWKEEAKKLGAKVVEINPSNEDLSGCQKIAPTFILNTTDAMQVHNEEIFGPISPIFSYKTLGEAVKFINDRPRPLALYFYGHNKKEQDFVLSNTISGGVTLNGAMLHLVQDDIPFGGVGDSGMGSYHGKEGFLTFSHGRSVHKKGRIDFVGFMRPPYNKKLTKLIYKLQLR